MAFAYNQPGYQNLTTGLWQSLDPDIPPSWHVLASDDFETDTGDVYTSHDGYTKFARTTNEPQSGTHCIRMNLKSVVDPITGILGDGLITANYVPPVPIYDHMRWKFNTRYDAANWISGPGDGSVKLMYILTEDTDNLATTFYISGNFGSDFLAIADNGGAGVANWYERSYGWRTPGGLPTPTLYFGHTPAAGADGLWHSFDIEIIYNYLGLGYSRMRLFFDGAPLLSNNGTTNNIDTNGWFNMPPEMVIAAARLGFGPGEATEPATDGPAGEYACGQQWDNLSVERFGV